MYLLSCHGSVVSLPNADGALTHTPLFPADPIASAMAFANGTLAEGTLLRHPELGDAWVEPGSPALTVRLQREGLYLSAHPDTGLLCFDRQAPGAPEVFLPLTAEDLADLRHILEHGWIEPGTRGVLHRFRVTAHGFRLRLGLHDAPLSPGVSALVAQRNARGQVVALRLGAETLVIAEPRSSALLRTDIWPVRARRTAEILALAAHRQIGGQEPDQEDFESTVNALSEAGGAPGLANLLENLLARQAEPTGTAARDRVLQGWARREAAPWLMTPLSQAATEMKLLQLNEQAPWAFVFKIAGGAVTLLDKPAEAGVNDGYRWRATQYHALLQQAASLLPADYAATLCIGVEDQLHSHFGLPLFGFQKTPQANTLMLPDIDFLPDFYAHDGFADRLPYEAKKLSAVFAGSTTGAPISLHTAENFATPRLRAARHFAGSADIDFRLPYIVQTETDEARAFLAAQSFCQKPTLSWEEQFRHRFLISIDGNGATCSRVAIALGSRSVLLKYRSDRQPFYFPGMEAWRHYIPIEHDAEVDRIIAMERESPGMFGDIAEEGARFARLYLSRDALLRYTAFLLSAYRECFAEAAARPGPNTGSLMIAHLAGVGDTIAAFGDWLGEKGSGRWIEGILVSLRADLPQEGFTIRPALQDGTLGGAATPGQLAGSRGEHRAMYGLQIDCGEDFLAGFSISVEASFLDGSTVGPCGAGAVCRSSGNAALEAVRVSISAKG